MPHASGARCGATARDAGRRNEEQQPPVYEEALERAGSSGDRVLDVGCGTGVFLRLCADRGAEVTGLDAVGRPARRRPRPRAGGRRCAFGDLQPLPFADDAFDLVTGLHVVLLRRRHGRRAARGRPRRAPGRRRDRGLRRPRALRPRGVKGAVAAPAAARSEEVRYWRPGHGRGARRAAGLDASTTRSTSRGVRVRRRGALARARCSPPAAPPRSPAPSARTSCAPPSLSALARCRQADGGYRVANEWEIVIARAA